MQQDQTMELLRGIYSLWDGEELPTEIKDSVESEVGILIFQGVIATSSMLLSDEKNAELERMLDENKPMHAIVAFLETEIKDFDLLVKDVGSIVMNNLKENK
jgi:hypothetical protein